MSTYIAPARARCATFRKRVAGLHAGVNMKSIKLAQFAMTGFSLALVLGGCGSSGGGGNPGTGGTSNPGTGGTNTGAGGSGTGGTTGSGGTGTGTGGSGGSSGGA
ncbi:MAG TPA: hypothetical protein VIF57_31230, partial [Polyangia bacterium]